LEHFLAEGPFAVALSEYTEMVTEGATGVGSSNDFSKGKEVGVVLRDHAQGFYASSSPSILIIGNDYKAFDAHQKKANMRDIARTVGVVTLQRAYNNQPWGPWKRGLSELLSVIWGKNHVYEAYFLTEEGKFSKMLVIDMLESGEFMTLDINNLTNRALASQLFDELATDVEWRNNTELLRMLFMGDDSIAFWFIVNSKDEAQLFRLIEFYSKTAIDLAAESGFDLNKLKTVVRLFYYEYLKKRALYGYSIPLRHVQLFSSERVNTGEYVIDSLIAYASKLSTIAGRGGNHEFLRRVLLYTWLFKRGVKIYASREEDTWYYLPMALLYTPISLGGVGQIPWCIYMASKDATIALHCYRDPKFMRWINTAATIVDHKGSDVKIRMAERVRRGMGTYVLSENGRFEYASPVEKGVKWMGKPEIMPPYKRNVSRDAKSRLRRIGAPTPDKMDYNRYNINRVETGIASTQPSNALENAYKTSMGLTFLRNVASLEDEPKPKIQSLFGWVDSFRIERNEKLETVAKLPTPFAFLDDETYDVINRFGIGGSPDFFKIRPKRFLDILKRDRAFPSTLTAEAIFEYITHPAIIRNKDSIVDALLYIGASYDGATEVALEIERQKTSFLFATNAQQFSFNDDVGAMLDLSQEGHKRVVNIDIGPEESIEALIREVVYMYAFTNGFIEKEWFSWNVSLSAEFESIVLRSLIGISARPGVRRLIKILSRKPWENRE
jgi:hypothetical protein